MLKIKSIKYKNILSNGNNWTEIVFDDARTILACGANGSGKSTVLSALVFCLYGKDFRGIKKGGLINSVNRKGLLTESIIENNGSVYKIIRGIKPDIFDIFKDDQPLPNDIKKEQQKYLETQILQFPYKSFKQHVATGSGEYVPFMKLTALARREFIDNFLEIDTFARMKSILKDFNDQINSDLKDVKKDVEKFKEQVVYIEKIQKEQSEEKDIKISELKENIKALSTEIEGLSKNRQKLSGGIGEWEEKLTKVNQIETHVAALEGKLSSLSSNKKQLGLKYKNIEHISNCPTCFQLVEADHKEKIRDENSNEIERITNEIVPIQDKIKKFAEVLDKKSVIQSKISDINSAIYKIDTAISSKNSSINHYNNQITELLTVKPTETSDLDETKKKLSDCQELVTKKTEDQSLYSYAALLLKDDGIKSVIIKKYVEILNQLINAYLTKFDFYVNFSFDENFNETIKSRHRDEFTYENFSEGEKARIDLSILFAFRSLAKMRSNLDCNLLIIDELLDSAMDANGIEDLRTIFEVFDDLNIFIISHREKASEMFEKTLEFKKIGHFSTMEVIN